MPKKTPTLAEAPALQLLQVNPATLKVRDQAREDATPDDELIASVRQHGIMQPPVVEPADVEGTYLIVIGHRRVGAAIAAGMQRITVIVRDRPLDSEALTLEQQIVENERRRALTAKDLTAGYAKLSLFGLRPEDIAAGVGVRADRVRAGLKVTTSKAASELVDQDPTIDLERAALIADFDEHPKLQRKLIETATTRPENFNRDLADLRTQREVDARVAKLKDQLDADDVPVVDVAGYDVGDWWTGKNLNIGKGRTLARLGIPVEDHRDCSGHAAVIHRAQSYYLKDDPSTWLLYVCTSWELNGHDAEPAAAAPTTEELEREAERHAAAVAAAERRQLVESNTSARREWIHGYLTTGRLRPTAAHFDLMAESTAVQIRSGDWLPAGRALNLIEGDDTHGDYDHTSADALVDAITGDSIPNLRIIVALAIATFERALDAPESVKYFAFLESQGYTLTDTDREHLTNATHAYELEQAEAEAEAEAAAATTESDAA